MGPFNIHFVKDVGLAFLASGGAMLWGAWRDHRSVAISGSTWPLLHALFHLYIQIHRGFPFDKIMMFDFAFVITPAFLGFYTACQLRGPKEFKEL